MSNISLSILDFTLQRISDITKESPQPIEQIFNNPTFEKILLRDQHSILNKLKKDGYIDFIESDGDKFPKGTALYFILFEGLLLLQNDGYAQIEINELDTKEYLKAYEKRMALYSKLLTYGTWYLVFATFLLAVVEILKEFCFFPHCP